MWKLIFKNSLYLTGKTFHLFLFLIVMMEITGCNPMEREEIERISSPDSIIDAVLIKGSAGATTSFVFEVYLVPIGDNVVAEENKLLFIGDKMVAIELQWIQPKLLIIQYEQGRIFQFSNFWSSREVQNFGYEVEILLIKK